MIVREHDTELSRISTRAARHVAGYPSKMMEVREVREVIRVLRWIGRDGTKWNKWKPIPTGVAMNLHFAGPFTPLWRELHCSLSIVVHWTI